MDVNTRQKKEMAIWERQAAVYDNMAGKVYEEAYSLSIDKVRSLLSPGQNVLEIGCGTGIITCGIAPCVKNVSAVDISPKMIDLAKDKLAKLSIDNVDCQVYDGYSLPYENASFDIVLLFNILQCVKEPVTLLKEAQRLLKDGGLVASATDCYAEPVPLIIGIKLSVQKLLKVLGVLPFISHYKKQDVNQLFEECSFEILETAVLHPAPPNYYLLARKKGA